MEKKQMKISLTTFIVVFLIAVIVLIGGFYFLYQKNENKKQSAQETQGLASNEKRQVEKDANKVSVKQTIKNMLTGNVNNQTQVCTVNLKSDNTIDIIIDGKTYPVKGIKNKITKIFETNYGNDVSPLLLLLLEDGTVEYVDIFETVENLNFKVDGKVEGANGVTNIKIGSYDGYDATIFETSQGEKVLQGSKGDLKVVNISNAEEIRVIQTIEDMLTGNVNNQTQMCTVNLKSDNTIDIIIDGKTYSVQGIKKEINKIYDVNVGNDVSPLLLLLMNDKTVEYVDIMKVMNNNETIDFKVDGKVEGAIGVKNIKSGSYNELDATIFETDMGEMVLQDSNNGYKVIKK